MKATVKVFEVHGDPRKRPAMLERIYAEAPTKDELRAVTRKAIDEKWPGRKVSVSFVKTDPRPGHVEMVAYLRDDPHKARKNFSIPGSRVRR